MTKPVAIVGGGLAGLVAAEYLLNQEISVHLITTDPGRLGGHFAGVSVDGVLLDIGSLMFEFGRLESEHKPYDINSVNGWVSSAGDLQNWLVKRVDLEEVPNPKMFYLGTIFNDFIISDNLDFLAGRKITPPLKKSGAHPSKKFDDGIFERLMYCNASRSFHGSEIHQDLIFPFMQKFGLEENDNLLAKYHRSFWLPLYYPETISAALGGDIGLLPYKFFRGQNSSFAAVVSNLISALKLSDRFSMEVDKNKFYSIEKISKDKEQRYADIIWACEPNKIQELIPIFRESVGNFKRKGIGIAYIQGGPVITDKSFPDLLNIIDAEFLSIRLKKQIDGFLSLEFSISKARALSVTKDVLGEILIREVCQVLGGVKPEDFFVRSILLADEILAVPNLDLQTLSKNISTWLQAQHAPMRLTANLLGIGSASLNDQICQGLYHARQVSEQLHRA